MRCRVSWSFPEKRGETMVRRKWLPPAFAPACPTCFPDSSRRSMDCGSSALRRSWIAAARFIDPVRRRNAPVRRKNEGASPRRFLDVAAEEQRLADDEYEHQACKPVQLEAHPVVAGQVVYGGQIDGTHKREKYYPRRVKSSPDLVRQGDVLSQHRLNQCSAQDERRQQECYRECPIKNCRLPLDKRRIAEI